RPRKISILRRHEDGIAGAQPVPTEFQGPRRHERLPVRGVCEGLTRSSFPALRTRAPGRDRYGSRAAADSYRPLLGQNRRHRRSSRSRRFSRASAAAPSATGGSLAAAIRLLTSLNTGSWRTGRAKSRIPSNWSDLLVGACAVPWLAYGSLPA